MNNKTVLNFDAEYLFFIILGLKKSTIRRNTNLKENDIVLITSESNKIARAKIQKIRKILFSEIDDIIAKDDGFKSAFTLKKTLQKYYPDLKESDQLVQIYFELIDIYDISRIENQIVNLIKMGLILLKPSNKLYKNLLSLKELKANELLEKIRAKEIRDLLKQLYSEIAT